MHHRGLSRALKTPHWAFLPAGLAAGPSCSRHPMVHQIEPSLKDCNKKRAAISCNAYFGAPSVGALRIQSCGLNLATSPRETNTSACAKCESVPKGMCNKKAATFVAAFSGAPSGTLPRAKERRTVAFLTALRAAALFEYLRRCTRSCLLKIEQQKNALHFRVRHSLVHHRGLEPRTH